MRNFAIALAACAAVGVAMPLSTSGASAEGSVIVVQPDRVHDGDRGLHRGWRHHEKVVIIKHRRHHDRDRDRDND